MTATDVGPGGAVESKGLKSGALGLMAATALLRAADQYDALAIVVGAAARGPIAGAMLGSVTYQVVHRSTATGRRRPCPRGCLTSRTRSSRGGQVPEEDNSKKVGKSLKEKRADKDAKKSEKRPSGI